MSYIGNQITGFLGTGSLTVTTSTVAVEGDALFSADGNVVLGDASSDTITINAATASIPNNLNIDSNTLFIDAANNRIGIGTNSPDRTIKIHQDNSYVWIADAAGGNVAFIGGGGSNDGRMRLYDSSHNTKVDIQSEAASYFNGGNVGIGTSSPDTPLEISTTGSGVTDVLKLTTTGTGTVPSIVFEGDQGGTQHTAARIRAGQEDASNGNIIFEVEDAGSLDEAVRIMSDGSVGIGTSSPSGLAHVYNGMLQVGSKTGDTSIQQNANAIRIAAVPNSSTEWGGLQWYREFSDVIGAEIIASRPSSAETDTDLIFKTSTNSSNAVDVGRFTHDGNLLVGTTSTSWTNTDGLRYFNGGSLISTLSGGPAAYFNRRTNDGNIVVFSKDGSTVGSIGVSGNGIYFGDEGDTGFVMDSNSDALIPFNPSTRAIRDNAIHLGSSSGRFKNFYLNGGIYFGSRSNALDDYEEGTWTPTNAGATLTVSSAKYTKIGRLVNVSCLVTANANTSGDWGGLPFTMDVNGIYSGSVGYQNDTAGETWNVLADSGTSWTMRKGATSEQLASGKNMRMSLTYYTT